MSARHVAAIALLVVATAVTGAAVMTNDSLRIRQLEQRIADNVQAADRYVDIGVVIHVVVGDPKADVLLETAPPMRVLRTHKRGGILDTRANPPRIVGPSRDPRVWFCSEAQEKIILHRNDEPVGKVALGGMGAGKTTAGVMWTYLRWLEAIELHESFRRQGGITAPTEGRMLLVLDEMKKLFAPNWFTFSTATNIARLCDGTTLRFISTKRQSAAQGSRIQGFNWSWWLGDEFQDQVDEYVHIIARLRSGSKGRGKRLGTATAKDDSKWREFKDSIKASNQWAFHQMIGTESPFIWPSHWEFMATQMTKNEYRRMVLAEDLPSDLAVYFEWNRERNLVAKPQIATDVTAAILGSHPSYLYRRATGLLCAHDPGVIYNTSVVLQLLMFNETPTWVVVGELQTKQTTQRQHAKALVTYLRDTFYVGHPTIGGPTAAVFVDPHGKGEAQTDYQSVYMAFQAEGLDVFNPAPMTGRIKRAARIEMVNRLLAGVAASDGIPRLVIAQAGGRPLAPRLVEAFESLRKRPGDDNPEGAQKKDEDDKTHAPAALAYGLWPFEQEAYSDNTIKLALAAVRHR